MSLIASSLQTWSVCPTIMLTPSHKNLINIFLGGILDLKTELPQIFTLAIHRNGVLFIYPQNSNILDVSLFCIPQIVVKPVTINMGLFLKLVIVPCYKILRFQEISHFFITSRSVNCLLIFVFGLKVNAICPTGREAEVCVCVWFLFCLGGGGGDWTSCADWKDLDKLQGMCTRVCRSATHFLKAPSAASCAFV